MKKQRATITIIVLCSIFFMLLGSQLATAEGGKIVFSKLIGDKWQIVVTDENGQNLQNLSKNSANDNEPSWSFDGKYITFVSDRNGTLNVYIMDADSSNQHQVTKTTTNNELREFYPSFSPDDKKLIFTRSTDWKFMQQAGESPQYKIYNIDIDGRNEKYLTDGYYARWSPDGKKIVFGNHGGIYTMDTYGKNQVMITDNGCYPSWSLDGKYIAFSYYNANSSINGKYIAFSYYNANSSINGKYIAFSYYNANSSIICKIDSDGDNFIRLTKATYDDIYPSWSPDGKYIVFTRLINNTGICGIYKVSVYGGTSTSLKSISEGGECPSWFDPAFARQYAVNPLSKISTLWGWIKQK